MFDETLEAFCERIGPPPERTVSLIGVGPGDPGLISVRGALRLRRADVVIHDLHHCSPVLWNLFDAGTERIYTGPAGQRPRMSTAEKTDLIRSHVEAGRRVVCLKGGDPFVFARGEQEVRALADVGIAVEVIPGPTSAIAGAAYAGIPLTDRNATDAVSLAVGKGSRDPGIPEPEMAAMVRSGTLAVYMGEENLAALCKQLVAAGLADTTPVTLVEHATRCKQRVVGGTLATIVARADQAGLGRPAVAYFGRHVAVQEQMRWFDRRPLFGQRILITRPGHQAAVLAGQLNALGADVVEAPTVTIEPLDDYAAVDDALIRLPEYDWLVLTSANGVDTLADRLRHQGRDARALASVRIAAIGPATAERLRRLFVEPDLVPDEFVAEGLARAMGATNLAGRRCLLLRSDMARKDLPELLVEAGAAADDIPLYRTGLPQAFPEPVIRDLRAGAFSWATFTSSSTFVNFARLLGADAESIITRLKLASIGPITSRTIRAAGFAPAVEADPYTSTGLGDAIAAHYAS